MTTPRDMTTSPATGGEGHHGAAADHRAALPLGHWPYLHLPSHPLQDEAPPSTPHEREDVGLG
ncbi:hypothetical protein [Stenotrophomonas maltophilia]|uniref:Uncharacterized protein n=1 Tax=Stenotrophomonas maltophilia TaxID=40324 RepID=A0A4S2D2G8_STEMA|nr:hypothetical protein [Stenotrophomonas maltophilia]TGY35235.1 hypothetical protein E5352_05810 [Stenotrophomonas maltophilia]